MAHGNDFSEIKLRLSDNPDFRYVSGMAVYQEQFIDTKLVGRHWSACGRIMDKCEFQPVNPDVPQQAFSINIDGQSLDWGWEFDGAQQDDNHSTLRLHHSIRPVSVNVHTSVDGTGFIERWLEITNTSDRPAALSDLSVFSGVVAQTSGLGSADYVKTPMQIGRCTGNGWAQEGRFEWSDLQNDVVTGLEMTGPYGTSGFQWPFFILRSKSASTYFAFYLGWSGAWKAEIVCDTTLRQMAHVKFGPKSSSVMRVIDPGETITTPAVHIGCVQTDLDGCVQAAHEHIHKSVVPKTPIHSLPVVSYNSAGSLFLTRDLHEETVLTDIEIASELGADAYIIDAGWFGGDASGERVDSAYSRFMGDWTPGRDWFPNGFMPIVNKLHEKGMLFGLWIEPEGIGLHSKIYTEHPDWVVKREGKPYPDVCERFNLDYTIPEAAVWLESELNRVVREYSVDILRIDGAPMSPGLGDRIYENYNENTTFRHYEILYAIFDRLLVTFPELIIENCCGGGGRVDLGIMSRSHRTQMTDENHPPRSIQILNGITMMLPPEMGTTFPQAGYPMSEWKYGDIDLTCRLAFLSSFYFVGYCHLWHENMQPQTLATVKRYIELYKDFMVPLLSDSRVFHHTPVLHLDGEDKTPYCVLEYGSADKSRTAIGVFKLTGEAVPYQIYPKSLDEGATYRVQFDNNGTTADIKGYELTNQGIRISLDSALASELILLTRIGQ
jgi:alpha-galactosidase